MTTRPAKSAIAGHQASHATAVIPACWTTAIAGTAARLTIGPAMVTRPNKIADAGNKTNSVASDAATTATAGRTTGGQHRARNATSATVIIAPVAPTVSRKPASTAASGDATSITPAAAASTQSG